MVLSAHSPQNPFERSFCLRGAALPDRTGERPRISSYNSVHGVVFCDDPLAIFIFQRH